MKKTIKSIITLTVLASLSLAYQYEPYIAPNGDIRGYDNDFDGRKETIYVDSYWKKDGTYVRGHYRAPKSTCTFCWGN